MDEPSLTEYYKTLEKYRFVELPNGNSLSLSKTRYGTISCMFNRKIQEQEFKSLFAEFFVRMKGIPTTLEEISKFIGLPEDDDAEVVIDIENDNEIVASTEAAVRRAMKYFADNINDMFAETLQRYMVETFVRTLLHESVEYIDKTEVEAFNYIMKLHGETMKKRMKIRKASGRKPKWNDEELQQILLTYDRILPVITEAKQHHRTIAGKYGWINSIKALYPQLPVDIIEQFDQKGLSAGALALSFAAQQHGKEATEYLRQKLMEIRSAQNKNK